MVRGSPEIFSFKRYNASGQRCMPHHHGRDYATSHCLDVFIIVWMCLFLCMSGAKISSWKTTQMTHLTAPDSTSLCMPLAPPCIDRHQWHPRNPATNAGFQNDFGRDQNGFFGKVNNADLFIIKKHGNNRGNFKKEKSWKKGNNLAVPIRSFLVQDLVACGGAMPDVRNLTYR